MPHITLSIVAASLLVLSSGVAARRQAPDAPPPPPPQPPQMQIRMMEASPALKALDADHDGVISAAELDNAPAALLTLDKNGDGKLTRDEVAGVMPARGRGRSEGGRGGEPPQIPAPGPTADELLAALLTYDKNKDGKLHKAEVPERQVGIFARGDSNNDGVLDGAELRKVTADQAAAPVAPARGRGGRGGFGPFDPVAAALDKDGNAEISAEEIAGASGALKALDKNGDGRLTEDEVAPMPNQGRGGRA